MKGYLSSAVLVLPLLLSGCVHKTNQAQVQPPLAPPIEDAPLPKPDTAPANLPPPVISLPDKNPTPPPQTTTTPTPAPQPPKKKKPKPTTPPAQTPAPSTPSTDQAANSAPEVPATGNFSSGDSTNLKDETQTMINDTDHALTGINRKLNDQEAKTYAQIKEFLKQARAAMTTNDMFGAHNLAVKAHVLLVELTQ